MGEHEHGQAHDHEYERERGRAPGHDDERRHEGAPDRTRPWVFGMGALGGLVAGLLLASVILLAAYGDKASIGGGDAAGVYVGAGLFGLWAGLLGGGIAAALPTALLGWPAVPAAFAGAGCFLACWPFWEDRVSLAMDSMGDGEWYGAFIFPVPELCVAAAVYAVLARARRRGPVDDY
ncbi:hypothetical protein [Yinghuangia soli]|uniref:Uncharacterized protein n=1 Tax=Yinghuangia soli TaxID=2908204 RepID=A0AA41Q8H5_9ACTN|nr:hypothetical protein [Yinghuangia soli]MCF2533182.1 hypothetical protein [Yinghuangia soli]